MAEPLFDDGEYLEVWHDDAWRVARYLAEGNGKYAGLHWVTLEGAHKPKEIPVADHQLRSVGQLPIVVLTHSELKSLRNLAGRTYGPAKAALDKVLSAYPYHLTEDPHAR